MALSAIQWTDMTDNIIVAVDENGDRHCQGVHCGATPVYRVGKKAAGRLLDGVEWSEFPAEVSSNA